MGEKKRARSAGGAAGGGMLLSSSHGGPVSLISRPATRSSTIQQWLISMRERGVIISDAEMRYRQWLALSESDRPLSPTTLKQKPLLAPPNPYKPRPLTAPASINGTYIVEHTKTSRLRLEKLPEPKSEVDYSLLARKKKQFDQQCRTASFAPVLAENCSDYETVHEFLVGSRYNCAQHIDSRSLHRLGVYISRYNVGSGFINPGGILPPNYARRTRKLPSFAETPSMPFFGTIPERGGSSVSFSSSLNSTALSQHSNERPEDCLSVVQQERCIVSKSEGDVTARKMQYRLPKSSHSEHYLAPVPKNSPVQYSRNDTGASDLLVSLEARHLADAIVQQSLEDSSPSTVEKESTVNSHTDVNVENCEENVDIEETTVKSNGKAEEPSFNQESTSENQEAVEKAIHENDDIANVSKSSSTIFVDMSKLDREH